MKISHWMYFKRAFLVLITYRQAKANVDYDKNMLLLKNLQWATIRNTRVIFFTPRRDGHKSYLIGLKRVKNFTLARWFFQNQTKNCPKSVKYVFSVSTKNIGSLKLKCNVPKECYNGIRKKCDIWMSSTVLLWQKSHKKQDWVARTSFKI